MDYNFHFNGTGFSATFMQMILLLSLLIALQAPVFASEAVDKALEATYHQTGLKGNVERIGRYVQDKTVNRSVILQRGLLSYMIYRDKCLKFQVNQIELKISPNDLEIRIPL